MMFRLPTTGHPGYVFLLSVLAVGAIATTVTTAFLLLSLAMQQSGQSLTRSEQAFGNAQTCAERALYSLFEDTEYSGSESITLNYGTCEIFTVGGSGNENRTVCTEGTYGGTTRRFEIFLERIVPSIELFAWQEVPTISSCSL